MKKRKMTNIDGVEYVYYEDCEYTHREDIILNWIEYFTSDDKERADMRINLQHYLQQEIWKELEGYET